MDQKETYTTLDQDSVENFKEALDCPVCLEPYNEGLHIPKMMPCLHTLCGSCIASLTISVTEQDPQPLPNSNTSPAGPAESSFRHAFLRFSQPNLTSVNTTQDLANHHPPLRRVAGQGPTSPTSWQPQHQPFPSPSTARPSLPHQPKPSLKRPDVSPPLPPQPGAAAQDAEPQIPRDVIVQCPLCRSDVSTSKLQTNRYVLAHMRDLARLSFYSALPAASPAASSTNPTAPTAPTEDYWCEDCNKLATDACSHHQLIPIAEWVETQKVTLESLHMAVEDQLSQHTTYLQNLQVALKDVYYALDKTTRFLWSANKQMQEFKDELKCQPPLPATSCPKEITEALIGKVAQLERLAKRVSKENLIQGNNEVLVSFRQAQQQILIRTINPNYALVLTIAEGHADV